MYYKSLNKLNYNYISKLKEVFLYILLIVLAIITVMYVITEPVAATGIPKTPDSISISHTATTATATVTPGTGSGCVAERHIFALRQYLGASRPGSLRAIIPANSVTFTGLTSGTRYQIGVIAYNGNCRPSVQTSRVWSNPFTAGTTGTVKTSFGATTPTPVVSKAPPTTPVNVVVTPKSTSAVLSWGAGTGACQANKWTVQVSPTYNLVIRTFRATVTGTTVNATGLSPNTNYMTTIWGGRSDHTSVAACTSEWNTVTAAKSFTTTTTTVTAVRPSTPVNVVVTPKSTSAVLSWGAGTGACQANKWTVQVSLGGPPYTRVFRAEDLTVKTVTATGLSPNTGYSATITGGRSDYDSVAACKSEWNTVTVRNKSFTTTMATVSAVPPARPTNIVVRPGNNSAVVTWQAGTGACEAKTYNLRLLRGGAAGSAVAGQSASVVSPLTHTFNNLDSGTRYTVTISSNNNVDATCSVATSQVVTKSFTTTTATTTTTTTRTNDRTNPVITYTVANNKITFTITDADSGYNKGSFAWGKLKSNQRCIVGTDANLSNNSTIITVTQDLNNQVICVKAEDNAGNVSYKKIVLKYNQSTTTTEINNNNNDDEDTTTPADDDNTPKKTTVDCDKLPDNWSSLTASEKVRLNPCKCSDIAKIRADNGQCLPDGRTTTTIDTDDDDDTDSTEDDNTGEDSQTPQTPRFSFKFDESTRKLTVGSLGGALSNYKYAIVDSSNKCEDEVDYKSVVDNTVEVTQEDVDSKKTVCVKADRSDDSTVTEPYPLGQTTSSDEETTPDDNQTENKGSDKTTEDEEGGADDEDNSSTVPIIGIIVLTLVIVGIIIFVVFKNKNSNQSENSSDEDEEQDDD